MLTWGEKFVREGDVALSEPTEPAAFIAAAGRGGNY